MHLHCLNCIPSPVDPTSRYDGSNVWCVGCLKLFEAAVVVCGNYCAVGFDVNDDCTLVYRTRTDAFRTPVDINLLFFDWSMQDGTGMHNKLTINAFLFALDITHLVLAQTVVSTDEQGDGGTVQVVERHALVLRELVGRDIHQEVAHPVANTPLGQAKRLGRHVNCLVPFGRLGPTLDLLTDP